MRVLRRSGSETRDDVGQRTDPALQTLGSALHDRRVEPGARHDEEDPLVGAVGRQASDVDEAVVAGQRDPRGRGDIGGQTQRPREQVAGARGQQAHCDARARQRLRDRPEGAVATTGDDHVGAALDGGHRLAGARILRRRQQPERRRPAEAGADGHDLAADGLVDLHGVDDHGGQRPVLRLGLEHVLGPPVPSAQQEPAAHEEQDDHADQQDGPSDAGHSRTLRPDDHSRRAHTGSVSDREQGTRFGVGRPRSWATSRLGSAPRCVESPLAVAGSAASAASPAQVRQAST
jgi:hypothetical protein